MQIFEVDNYAREDHNERVVCAGIEREHEAKIILEALQKDPKRADSSWFRIATDDENPYIFEP